MAIVFSIHSFPRNYQMNPFPDSLLASQRMVPDDDACAT